MSSSYKFLAATSCALLFACGSEEAPTSTATPAPEPAATESVAANTAAETAAPELGSFGIDLSHQDADIKPGDDFFRYTNGRWLETFELPASRSNYGSFAVLGDRSDQRVRTIVDDLASMEPAAGSIEQKISDYYLSYMDVETLNELGISPLLPGLATLNEIETREDLITGFGRAQIDNTASPFGFYISADRADADRHQLTLSIGGLGLPDRDYYLEDTEEFIKVREEYVAHITRILDFANIENSAEKAEAILSLETQVAEHTWPRSQRRNRDLTYNPMSYEDFKAEYAGLDWDSYFAAAGVQGLTDLNVFYPSAMSPIIDLVNTLPVEDWKSYMTYRFITDSANVLSEEIDQEAFHFYSTV
ncbi:MAG: M13 family peptidase, partial [OM182 bacterium]